MKEITEDIAVLQQHIASIKFNELVRICDRWFGNPRINGGSHRVYAMPWPGDPRVNIQRGRSNTAKAYQVKQVIDALIRLEGQHGSA